MKTDDIESWDIPDLYTEIRDLRAELDRVRESVAVEHLIESADEWVTWRLEQSTLPLTREGVLYDSLKRLRDIRSGKCPTEHGRVERNMPCEACRDRK